MFLVKREESRGFDVFFKVLFVCFLCLEEGKNLWNNQAESKIQENVVFFWSEGCLGLFIALARTLRRRPLKGHHLEKRASSVKGPKHPPDQKKGPSGFCSLPE